ncbi:uncharacterized protein P174DRAFT_433193 [Aspergillus novofumigatus IBT 16806]|uniref:Uncharacterized protein n=1 Tax=Aspergillus novofumigatus (strain IBT 16806) TaxID=1392255 RepID=A0A2I1C2E6_ASPN1|nr:uncharacterized protein P174DRAFT_433193 [Aspergillus novofumigatus IBT 16806]PKX91761.1 hypothetical protein P174DRAFT_433193 [Aspergillus novofumigatus IBT 16806]
MLIWRLQTEIKAFRKRIQEIEASNPKDYTSIITAHALSVAFMDLMGNRISLFATITPYRVTMYMKQEGYIAYLIVQALDFNFFPTRYGFTYTGDVSGLAWTGQRLNLRSLGRFLFMGRKTIAPNRVVDSVIIDMEGFAVLSVRRRRLDNVGLSSRHGVGGHLKANIGDEYIQFTSHAT